LPEQRRYAFRNNRNKEEIVMKKKIVFIIVIIILFVIIIISFCNENIDYSKENLWYSTMIADNLFEDGYKVYAGGVWGGDVHTVYLTDSVKFRCYLGQMMDYENIIIKLINDDSLTVYKVVIDSNPVDTIETKTYSIYQLKKDGKFE
jgi:hypothetical protein